MTATAPSLAQAERAQAVVRRVFPPSPLVALGSHHFKAEYRLPTGSFKVRGALAAVWALRTDGADYVIAASAGNHGLGVAFAGERFGVRTTIVVPRTCPRVKLEEMEAIGRGDGRSARTRTDTEIVVAPADGYDEAEAHARELASEHGVPFLSPFDDTWVMAGNGGTVALELLDQLPDLGCVVLPVGGGGLLSGVLAVLAERAPHVQVIAVQSEASPAFHTSLRTGRLHTRWPAAATLAEGLEGGTGRLGVALAQEYGVRAETVSEARIAEAMVRLLDGLGETVEGSAAVVEAFLAGDASSTPWEPATPCVGILTGGNVTRKTVEQLRDA